MKKILSFLLLILIFTVTLAPAAFAADYYLVYDEAGVFTEDEDSELEERAQEITDKYGCDVVIIVVDKMEEGYDAEDYSHAFYEDEELGFGYGAAGNCIMLFLSTADRDYDLRAWGTLGHTAFTDYGKDVMLDRHILPLLKKDNYYEAFTAYLDKAEDFLYQAKNGTPFDRNTDPDKEDGNLWWKILFTLFFPLFIAFMLCEKWRKEMKTAVTARAADAYIPAGGFKLTAQHDQFLYRTETRTKIERSSSSGGTTVNSRGSSGRSGKY